MSENSYALDLATLPVFDELREHRAEMNVFFSSKGWELWLKVAAELEESLKKTALEDVDPRIREEARARYMALRQFQGLRLNMVWALEGNADSAPGIPQATEDAKQEG